MATTPTGNGPPLLWIEIGRAATGNEPWVAWVTREDPDLTFYRCLIVVAGTALVTVDLQRRRAGQMQRLHSGQCPLPQGGRDDRARVAGLLEGADRAIRHALGDVKAGASRAA
jgi:hypothetical protein